MNHYDTLGVAPGSAPDEIRAAYRRAARAAHPDRHGESSANRMAVVNEAWRVLGDPMRRQRYDLELADAGRPPTASASRREASTPRDEHMPTPMPTGDMSRFPWRLFAILFVVGVVVVFVGNTLTDPPPPVPIDNFLLPGECVVFGEVLDEIVPAACDGSHDAVVVVVGMQSPADCPTGTRNGRDPLRGDVVCVDLMTSSGG